MNNVCLPGQVAILFKRLVHVVSTLSVAQQYHFYNRNRPTTEHTSSQPAIESQDLSFGQAFINADRSPPTPRVLVDQWDRTIRGRSPWEPSRSGPWLVQQSSQQPNSSPHLSLFQLSFRSFHYSRNHTAGMVQGN